MLTRELTVHDAVSAGIAVGSGLLVAFLSRSLLL